jgi:hypothetical protein
MRKSRGIRAILRAALLGCGLSLAAGAAMSHPVVDYRIRAELDTASKIVSGQETLTWRNDSPDTVTELRFHLYLNAFRNGKSTFMREWGGPPPGDFVPGAIEIQRMQVAGGADLTRALRFIQPDDGNVDDRTVAAVTLPDPVRPGQSITLDIAFLSKLPKYLLRTGFSGDYFMVAQWFPKLGVYEKAGDRYAATGAWNCHQFHAATEFYADYGVYDVSVTVPSNYVVGATGVEQSETADSAKRRKTYRFYQEDVHDFCWTASPRFMRVERLFEPARVVSGAELQAVRQLLGLSAGELGLKPVRMVLLMQPEHRGRIDRHFRALENGLKWYGLWYGAYPYETITLLDPPVGGGGMEYPTFITAYARGVNEQQVESRILHEFAHQYWYGMVGTNEFEEAWLDEGFATYSAGKLYGLAYGERDLGLNVLSLPVAGFLGLPKVSWDATMRADYLEFFRKRDPLVRNGWEYYDDESYHVSVYARPAVLLRTMENHLGAPVMARIMRAWFQRYRFHHPSTLDFEKLVNEVSGRDMGWFFDEFVFGTNWLNYRVDGVECQREGGRRPERYHITVKLTREGEAVFPVEMKMTLDNGEIVRGGWNGRDRWVKLEYTETSPVKSVEIDPERKILLDGDFTDNSYVTRVPVMPFAKWASNLLCWLQLALP